MLVTNKEVLSVASAGGYAVGAFKINNMEILQAIVETAAEEKSPIIVSVSPSAVQYAGLEYLVAMVKAARAPRKVLGPAKQNMKKVVQEKMRLFGSSGTAV